MLKFKIKKFKIKFGNFYIKSSIKSGSKLKAFWNQNKLIFLFNSSAKQQGNFKLFKFWLTNVKFMFMLMLMLMLLLMLMTMTTEQKRQRRHDKNNNDDIIKMTMTT